MSILSEAALKYLPFVLGSFESFKFWTVGDVDNRLICHQSFWRFHVLDVTCGQLGHGSAALHHRAKS